MPSPEARTPVAALILALAEVRQKIERNDENENPIERTERYDQLAEQADELQTEITTTLIASVLSAEQ